VGERLARRRECGFPRFDGCCDLAIGPGLPDGSPSYFHCSCLFRVAELVQSQFDVANSRRRVHRVAEYCITMKAVTVDKRKIKIVSVCVENAWCSQGVSLIGYQSFVDL